MKKKHDFISVKILRDDYKRTKRWAISKDKKFYEIISLLIHSETIDEMTRGERN